MVVTQPLGRIAVGFPTKNIYVYSYTLKYLSVENGSWLESVNGLECFKMMPPRMTPASVDLVSGGGKTPPASAVSCCGRGGVTPPRAGGAGGGGYPLPRRRRFPGGGLP